MDETIKNLCTALKEEAEEVISYTDKISAVSQTEGMESAAQMFEMIRLDKVEHIQNLTLEITKLMSGTADSGQTDE